MQNCNLFSQLAVLLHGMSASRRTTWRAYNLVIRSHSKTVFIPSNPSIVKFISAHVSVHSASTSFLTKKRKINIRFSTYQEEKCFHYKALSDIQAFRFGHRSFHTGHSTSSSSVLIAFRFCPFVSTRSEAQG